VLHHIVYLCVWYGSHTKQGLFPWTALTGWSLWRGRNTFPVRYELNSYIHLEESQSVSLGRVHIKWGSCFFFLHFCQTELPWIYCTQYVFCRGRDSSVGTATGYGASVFDSWKWWEIFLFSTASRPALGLTQPPIEWVRGALSKGIKRPRRKFNHSPPSSAEVKNSGAILPLPRTSWRGA
jgi:hypothetical protein